MIYKWKSNSIRSGNLFYGCEDIICGMIGFVEVFKNLVKYRFENNFVRIIKIMIQDVQTNC